MAIYLRNTLHFKAVSPWRSSRQHVGRGWKRSPRELAVASLSFGGPRLADLGVKIQISEPPRYSSIGNTWACGASHFIAEVALLIS